MSFLRELFPPTPKQPRNKPITNELLPELKDSVFRQQIESADFVRLDEEALLRAEIALTHHKATQVLHAAHKTGMIDANTGRPDTSKITRNMVHDMPVLGGISKQREFVMLLFFWEEEITRWQFLDADERDIRQKLQEPGLVDGSMIELEEALKTVQARKRILPSLRDQSGNVIQAGNEQLPKYDDTSAA